MGILNATPDSFSDGGKFNQVERAVKQAAAMKENGADIIDIGGESTRPGHEPVPLEEELNRVLPIIEAVKSNVDIPISVDTYKSEMAKQALDAGADIINDIWGAKKDHRMAPVAAAYDAPIILMHNRNNTTYNSLIDDMEKDLKESIDIARNAGVKNENILLDPGIGFAKTTDDNFIVMKNLDRLASLGYPILLGTSRKSFIGKVLDLPAEQRDEGTGATVCYGIDKGVHLVRVHNVTAIARMVKMMDAMVGKGGNKNG